MHAVNEIVYTCLKRGTQSNLKVPMAARKGIYPLSSGLCLSSGGELGGAGIAASQTSPDCNQTEELTRFFALSILRKDTEFACTGALCEVESY